MANYITFFIRTVINSLIVLFLFSCGNVGGQATKRMNDPLDYKFEHIERRLQKFAIKYNAKLSTVWSKLERHDPDGSDSFLVKHIVWTDGRLGKAVIIQQHNDIKGVDTTAWDILNLAWLEDTQLIAKPTYVKYLLTKVDFQIIERNIEQQLNKSEKSLSMVKVDSLK